jgi:hypothetical protein
MKILIHPNKKLPMSRVESLISTLIARKGYSVGMKSSWAHGKIKWTHYVDDIKKLDQDLIKNLVIAECEQLGLKYEIKQKKES